MSDTIIISGNRQGPPSIGREPVRPTIIIGVGGSGGDVMLRIRKRFYEKYGPLSNIPIVSYLWLDTDTTEKDVGAGTFEKEIRFTPTEKLMTTIPDTTAITNDLNQHPHIKKWFYPGLTKLKMMTEGAGQIRAYSRLGFFQHYDAIRSALIQAQSNVLNTDNERLVRERLGLELDSQHRLQVFIIFSVAGGTGSGMFLDLAFLAKNVFPGLTPTTIGYLMMPGLFKPDEERVFANSYAALKELEHYTYENDFAVAWKNGDNREPLPGPPFTYTYLIDNRNNTTGSVNFQSRHQVFNMVAENIFRDFTQGEFAAYKRGVRVNLDQYLYDKFAFRHLNENGESIIEQKFITRYSSFGLAAITVPADRIEQACAYNLAADVVDQWGSLSNSEFRAAQLTEEVTDRLLPAIQMKQGNVVVEGLTQQRNDILTALADDGQGIGQTMYNRLTAAITQAAAEVNGGVHAQKGHTLAQYLRVAADQQTAKFRNDAANQQEWGDFARAVYFNKNAYQQKLQQNLVREISRIINDQHQSVGYAIALLNQVVIVLRDENREYIANFTRQATQLPRRIQDARQQLEQLYTEISDHENRGSWSFFGRKQDVLRNDVEKYEAAATRYLHLLLNYQLFQTANEVCEEFIAFLGAVAQEDGATYTAGLIGQLYTLGGELKALRATLLEGYEHFRRAPQEEFSLLLYSPEDIENQYLPRYLGTGERKAATVRSIGDQILGHLRVSVLELPRLAREKGVKALADEIRNFARQPFRNIRQDFDVLEKLWATYPNEAQLENEIRAVYNRAMFWLNGGGGQRAYPLGPQRQKILVGVPETSDTVKLNRFKEMLLTRIQVAGGPTISLQSVPERSEIVFYTELGGVPINWANSVSGMRQHYLRKQAEGEELHTDHQEVKFNDLVILSNNERQQLEDAHKCFLLGLIFGEIKPEKDTRGNIRYTWAKRIGVGNRFSQHALGIELRALSELMSNEITRRELLNRVEKRLGKVMQDDDSLARFNALLTWYFEKVYPEKKTMGPDGVEHHEQSHLCRAVAKQIEAIAVTVRRRAATHGEEQSEAEIEAFSRLSEQYDYELGQNLAEISVLLADGRRALKMVQAPPVN